MAEKVVGYSFAVNSAYTDVDARKSEELQQYFEKKYGVTIFFPILYKGRHAHDTHRFDVTKRDLDLFDEVLDTLNNNRYMILGIERLLK